MVKSFLVSFYERPEIHIRCFRVLFSQHYCTTQTMHALSIYFPPMSHRHIARPTDRPTVMGIDVIQIHAVKRDIDPLSQSTHTHLLIQSLFPAHTDPVSRYLDRDLGLDPISTMTRTPWDSDCRVRAEHEIRPTVTPVHLRPVHIRPVYIRPLHMGVEGHDTVTTPPGADHGTLRALLISKKAWINMTTVHVLQPAGGGGEHTGNYGLDSGEKKSG